MQHQDVLLETEIVGSIPSNSKKILIATVPADGHVNPLTGIAKHLQSLGYEVRWYASAMYEKKITQLGIPFYPFRNALEVNGDNLEQLFPERQNIKGAIAKVNFDLINFFMKRGPEYYQDIKDIYEDFDFDLMLADCMFTGIPFVADLMKVPVVSIGIMPIMETSKNLAPTAMGKEPSYSFFGQVKQNIMRAVATKILFRKSVRYMHEILNAHGIQTDGAGLFDVLYQKSKIVLQSGTPSFEYKRSDLSSNIKFVGSILPYDKPGLREPWFDSRLNKYDRIILVTQGTVEKDVNKLLVPVLDAYKGKDVLVVATTGGSQTAELRSLYPHQNIIIEDFIPFNDIMPYADVYITNGGYGGVMLSIENNVPMIVGGVHEGKSEICARVGYFNYGINLKTETPSPLQISEAVKTIFMNPEYRKNVIRLNEEFATYPTMKLCTNYIEETLRTYKSKS